MGLSITQRRDSKVNGDRRPHDQSIEPSIFIIDTGADQCAIGGDAWEITEIYNDKVQCNGYLRGKHYVNGPILPIVSAITCAEFPDVEPVLLMVHHACYNEDVEQTESLLHPFQAMEHGVRFDTTPRIRKGINDYTGLQRMNIEERNFDLQFDGRKMYINIRRPTDDELRHLELFELTSPLGFSLLSKDMRTNVDLRREKFTTKKDRYPGGLSLETWQKRLAMAPFDVIRKTFEATTQMAPTIEVENRSVARDHFKSRFPFFKWKRLNDEFHSDTFFPSVNTNQGHTCSQLFIGKDTDYMDVYPMRTESQSYSALQDFGRKVGIPRIIKTDNAKTEVGTKWTNWCRTYMVDTKFTEPMHPWQNRAERAIGDLGTMVKRCHRAFNAPLSRHHWCQKWCKDVRNILASRKLKWRTPKEKLTGETPDLSPFRFHFWEPIEYFDTSMKQPASGWKPGRFLGIDWDSGDFLTYFIETEKCPGEGRNMVLTRSNIRSRDPNTSILSDSGEQDSGELDEFNTNHTRTNYLNNDEDKISSIDQDSSDAEIILDTDNIERNLYENDLATTTEVESNSSRASLGNEHQMNSNIEQDDLFNKGDEINLDDEINDINNNEEEDYEFSRIKDHKWTDGSLVLDVELTSGKVIDIPFHLMKKDRPLELARYIRNYVIEEKRGGMYEMWAKKIIKQANRTIRRLKRYHNIERLERLRIVRTRRMSRNKRMKNKSPRIKFGIKVPNSIREAFELDIENKNNLWADAIVKELTALNEAGVFQYWPPHHKIDTKIYQFTPLRMIFDVKSEDLRRKARMVAGGHVVDATMFESYASVVHTRSIRLLMTVAVNHNIPFVTGDIGNAFVQAKTKEKIYSIAGKEFGQKQGCILILQKALYGLATSARAWNLELGDTIRSLGFKPTRADPDLWIKIDKSRDEYEYIGTYVDDLIMVSNNAGQYLQAIKDKYPIRNISYDPEYYLGNNVERKQNKTLKISNKKYINEVLNNYERQNGDLKKEKVPMSGGDHPELDESPELSNEEQTKYQSNIGILQWIVTSGRFDISYAVASLSRFNSRPREGHMKRVRKIFGYLKKYPKRGFLVDPREFDSVPCNIKLEPDFGNQYADFLEEIDEKLPIPKMKELSTTILVDSDHGHDRKTGRSITGIISFVGQTPIYWSSKRQGAVQTATFGAEFTALKKAVEEAVTMRYYLRSMGVKVTKPSIIYGDNLSAIVNITEPGSQLNKKYLALSYHYCREHFSAGIVDIRKINGKDNCADALTKSLNGSEFHGHFSKISEH